MSSSGQQSTTKQLANNQNGIKSWTKCTVCINKQFTFTSATQFAQHLRDYHCTKEGGSFVCRFGENDICSSLPLEGVSDQDYEAHIAKCHIFPKKNLSTSTSSQKNYISSQGASVKIKDRKSKRKSLFPAPNVNALGNMFGETKAQSSQPNLVNDELTKWNVYSSSQNLASVLNDPSKPRSYSETFFTRDWGASFVDTGYVTPSLYHPKISRAHFDNYIKKILKRSRLQRLRSRSDSISLQQQIPLRNIENHVPKIFFNPDFDLENPEFFKQILSFCTNKELLLQTSPLSPIKWNSLTKDCLRELQRNYSEYLDIVEENLAAQIALRSKDFFQVMSAMDTVMNQLSKTIKEVTLLRRKCSQLDESFVKSRMKNIQLTRIRSNIMNVLEKINLMATVNQTQPTIQMLLSNSVDFVAALALISTSQEVVSQEFTGIHSFRHLKLQLVEIEKVIDQIMQEEFVKYLTAEWNRPLEEEKCIQEEEKLLAIVFGMLRIQRFNFIEVFREEGCTAIKAVVKQTVIEVLSSEDDIEVGQRDGSLFDQLRGIDFNKWINLLNCVFKNLITLLKRIKAVQSVMCQGFADVSDKNADEILSINNPDISDSSDETFDTSKILLEVDSIELTSNLKESLCSICDFAHARCANLIESRAKNGGLDKLSSSEFVQLAKSIEDFASICHDICGRRSPNLKLVLQTQANKFATRFHEERKKKLNSHLDIEQWKSIDSISFEFRDVINQITEKGVKFHEIQRNKQVNGTEQSKKIPFLLIKQEKFVVVNAVIRLVNMMIEYCQCAYEIKTLSPDLLTRLLDLLKQFNARTSQLVLGAGALQVSGLKTITARNLIISSRSLKLVMTLIPFIKSHFQSILPAKQQQMCKHFDEILRAYKDHIEKIPEKVICVVKEVADMQLTKWEAKPPVPSPQFLAVSQHLVRLHENIQDALPNHELENLFKKIQEAFKQVLRTHLMRLKIVNDGSPQHGLVIQELTFHVQNLSKLSVAKNVNFTSDDIWN